MDTEHSIKRYICESDEARIDDLLNSIKIYLSEIQDVKTRVASIHLLIRKLRDLSNRYQKMIKNWWDLSVRLQACLFYNKYFAGGIAGLKGAIFFRSIYSLSIKPILFGNGIFIIIGLESCALFYGRKIYRVNSIRIQIILHCDDAVMFFNN